ncbi:hypothetical protein ABTJ96_19175, partial [Acinetobacter baumannii]
QNGMGNVNSIGNQKVTNCQNQNMSGSNQLNLECEAINLVNKSATSRPIYEIDPKKDPLVKDSKETIKVSGESATQASIEGSTNQFCFNKEFDVKPVFENKQ